MKKSFFLLFCVAAVATTSCGNTQLKQCQETCVGCCSSDGTCEAGISNEQCGSSGESCNVCSSETRCASGRCVSRLTLGDGKGGSVSTGGALATGGAISSGGVSSTGGTPSNGGALQSGGAVATGGATNMGGSPATGGAASTGGNAAGGGISSQDLGVLSAWRGRVYRTYSISSTTSSLVALSISVKNSTSGPLTLGAGLFAMASDGGLEYPVDASATSSAAQPCTSLPNITPGATASCTLVFVLKNVEKPMKLFLGVAGSRISATIPPVSCSNCGADYACVDLQTDPAHCGSCQATIHRGLTPTCTNGVLSCSQGKLCPGVNGCVDVSRDSENCGACGNKLPSSLVCAGGVPKCTDFTKTNCNNTCVDLTSDPNNCGSCGNKLPSNAACLSGMIFCTTSGQFACGNVCTDGVNDSKNCGGCGKVCPSGMRCSTRQCVTQGAQNSSGSSCDSFCAQSYSGAKCSAPGTAFYSYSNASCSAFSISIACATTPQFTTTLPTCFGSSTGTLSSSTCSCSLKL